MLGAQGPGTSPCYSPRTRAGSLETSSNHDGLGWPDGLSHPLPLLGSRPVGGSSRHPGQRSKGQHFPQLEFCLSVLLIPGFSAPQGGLGLNPQPPKAASSAAAPSSQRLHVNFGAETSCSPWQDQQPPAFLSSIFGLFKIKGLTVSEGRRGGSQLHEEKGRPSMHLGSCSSESPGLVGSLLVAFPAPPTPPPPLAPPVDSEGKQVCGFHPPQPRASSSKTPSYLCRDFQKRFFV